MMKAEVPGWKLKLLGVLLSDEGLPSMWRSRTLPRNPTPGNEGKAGTKDQIKFKGRKVSME